MGELVISKVDKIYRGRKTAVHAVKALDLTVKPGEIVALLGSSGCGKTSTLRMIAGFEDVTSGSITRVKMRHSEQPSTRAACSSSSGRSEKKARMKKVPNEVPVNPRLEPAY